MARPIEVTANEGVNHLHGGALGFGKRVWRVLDVSERPGLPRGARATARPTARKVIPGNVDATVELR